jgi:translin
MQSFEQQIAELKAGAEAMHSAREAGLALCRKLIQSSAKSIRSTHRHEFDEARSKLGEAKSLAQQAREALVSHPSLYYAGYLQDAEKELVEAAAVLAVVLKEPIPGRVELGVGLFTYLHGLGEAASEVRRYCLDSLRQGDPDQAERILRWMESIYDELIGFDFADGMTGGLRRTTDALRAVVERTRSDLSATQVQQNLMAQLEKTQKLLSES